MTLNRQPAKLNEIVRLRVPRGVVAIIDAPNGMQLYVPAPEGYVDLWCAQIGTWTYSWAHGDFHELEVVEADTPTPPSEADVPRFAPQYPEDHPPAAPNPAPLSPPAVRGPEITRA